MLLFLMRLKLWQTLVGISRKFKSLTKTYCLPFIHPSIQLSQFKFDFEFVTKFVNSGTFWMAFQQNDVEQDDDEKNNKHYRYLCLINSVLNSNLNCFSCMKLFATHLNVFDEAFNRYWCATLTHIQITHSQIIVNWPWLFFNSVNWVQSFFDNGEFDVRGCVVCAKKVEFNLKAENILLCNNLIVTVQG